IALYDSSLRWFETHSCKPVSRGHPLISCAAQLLWKCLNHSSSFAPSWRTLIQMPAPLRIAAHVRDASLTNLGGEHRAKPVPPEPDRLVAEGVSALLIRFPARAVGASGPECVASGLHGPMSIPRSANRSSTLRSD